jgi:hypothetical protein
MAEETIAEREETNAKAAAGVTHNNTGLGRKVQPFHFGGIMNWEDISEYQCKHWAAGMRTRYRAGQLSPEQIAACESIPGWSWELKNQWRWLPFEEARAFVHTLGLKSYTEWTAYRKSDKKPKNLPGNPNKQYTEWSGYGDWLGNGHRQEHKTVRLKAQVDMPFEEARAFARALTLHSGKEWYRYYKANRPTNLPYNPHHAYAGKGWISWGDWLGTATIAPKNKRFRSFEDARAFVRTLGLKTPKEWEAYRKTKEKPLDIPTTPSHVYAGNGWVNWADWLGTEHIRGKGRLHYKVNAAGA